MGHTDQAVLTKQGDASALSALITAHLPYWMSAARQIIETDGRSRTVGGPKEEPAELVQEALLKLLEQWQNGQGPTSNPRAYVTTIMRNSYANKFRSPRARERPLEESAAEEVFTTAGNIEQVDVVREMEVVARAMSKLKPEHRTVLQAVTVEGRKPGDLTEMLDRPAPAISNLLSRAKHALYRQVLIEHLGDGEHACQENAERLPSRVREDPSLHAPTDPGIQHIDECEPCQHNWRRFATILSAFGLLPLLIVTQLHNGAAPAAATTGDAPPEPHSADKPQAQSQAAGHTQAPRQNGGAPSLLRMSAALTTPAPAAATALATGPSTAGPLTRALSSRIVLAVGIACLLVSAAAGIAYTMFGTTPGEEITYTGAFDDVNPYGLSFDVTLDTTDAGVLHTIRADLAAQKDTPFIMRQLTLDLSPGTKLLSAPDGLECDTAGEITVCAPIHPQGFDRSIVFEVQSAASSGSFILQIDADADGTVASGRASGSWRQSTTGN